ncbi:MAG: sugar transferase [Lachnospiraceae bacterium]
MEKKKFEQFKRAIRVSAAFVVVAIVSLIFLSTWIKYYNTGIVFPFYNKGHWLLMAIYVIIFVLFLYIYGGLKFGYLKDSSIILSQVLSLVCTNVLIYLVISLLSAKIVDPTPLIIMTGVDGIIVFILAKIITQIFQRLFPPRRLLLLYDEYDPININRKLKQRNDRYVIELMQSIKGLTGKELAELIKGYDAVLIFDLHSEVRNKILKYCYAESIRVYTTPKISDIIIKGSENIHLFDSPLLLMRNNGLTFEQKVIKRIMDIVISLLVLIITSPIMLIVAIAIKVYDGGPVLFRQDRCTVDGRIFSIHKFRSMIVDAEKDGKVIPTTDGDPRITPIGSFIRKIRLDELPQMIDILAGNMSVVGPRPERVEHVEAYTEEIPEFEYRLKVKGGLTGFAQIYGKYNTTAYDKLKLDLMYIENYSLLMDIRLIFMTIKIMFMKESTEGFDNDLNNKKI